MEHQTGLALAKSAYIKGNIDLETFERAVEDRLTGTSHAHDARIDGHIPGSVRGDDYEPFGYKQP